MNIAKKKHRLTQRKAATNLAGECGQFEGL
jgi:hypothetical protein